MTTPQAPDLSALLSRRLANFQIPDHDIEELTKHLQIHGLQIGRLDICAYGICVDYLAKPDFPWNTLLQLPRIQHVEIFPYGIVAPERYHLRLAFDAQRAGRLAGPR